jgi:transposase
MAANRHQPHRANCLESAYSLMEFMREYPDDAACLEHLWRERYSEDGEHAECPKCGCERVFRKYATAQGRQSWTCNGCGLHVHPTAGTIFHKSSTSLHLWFYAMYLVASTRCGISAKNLERAIGVSYPTAWRMLNKIRNEVMVDDGTPLQGDVEVDEASVDGKPRKPHGYNRYMAPPNVNRRSEAMKLRERSRATVFAAVERHGRIKATVLPSRRGPRLKQQVIEWVDPRAIVITDEWPAYNGLQKHFLAHSRVNHSAGEYVNGDTHTNTIEGLLWQPQAIDQGHLPQGVPQVAPGLSQRVHMALQPAHPARPSMFAELVTQSAQEL